MTYFGRLFQSSCRNIKNGGGVLNYIIHIITLEKIFILFTILFAFFMPLFEGIASTMMILSIISGCFLLKRYDFNIGSFKGYFLVKIIMLFFMIIFIVTLFSTNRLESLNKYVGLVKCVLPFFLLIGLKESKARDLIKPLPIFVAFLLGTTCASLYSIYQYIHTGQLYVTAFYGHHAVFGSFMELSLPITLALLFVAETKRQQVFYIISGIICLVALIMTQARGPWIASFAGMVTVAILFRHRIMMHKRKALFCTLFLLCVIILAAPLYSKRVVTLVDPQWASNYIRVMIWKSTLQMIHDYPLVGVGLDQFSSIYNPLYLNPLSPERFHGHGHNTYLTFAAECGLIGLIAFMALLYGVFHTLWIQMKAHSRNPYVIACIGIFIALLVNSLVDRIFWEARLAKLFWLFMGLMIYNSKDLQRK